jgi:hypothetical protein
VFKEEFFSDKHLDKLKNATSDLVINCSFVEKMDIFLLTCHIPDCYRIEFKNESFSFIKNSSRIHVMSIDNKSKNFCIFRDLI